MSGSRESFWSNCARVNCALASYGVATSIVVVVATVIELATTVATVEYPSSNY